jgi:hypothetical protein
MPPFDSTTGSVCCPRSFSALGDQRAEILPVQRPPALAGGGRYMMRLTRILMFPFFSLSIMNQLPLHRGAFQNAERTFLGNFHWRINALNRPVNLVPIFGNDDRRARQGGAVASTDLATATKTTLVATSLFAWHSRDQPPDSPMESNPLRTVIQATYSNLSGVTAVVKFEARGNRHGYCYDNG